MPLPELLDALGEASLSSAGFFWKSAWAFVLGYAISAMIQAFVPRARLTERMGGDGLRPIGLATAFGAISSSCSFAALAAARTLIAKGASTVAGLAFMFASTNLVIELGILIVIFLGWPYLIAELAGGLMLIGISTTLFRWTAPDDLSEQMRSTARETAPDEPDDFDWRSRIRSVEGWEIVGERFVGEWRMVWKEIAIGFVVAGFIATLVPESFWRTLFLTDATHLPGWFVRLENALVAPLVAASTFIGSMGNIPLATVLGSSGAALAGVLAFLFSDLMIPPLVRVNARYYGWRGALWIAGVMFVSIVSTALILDTAITATGIALPTPAPPASHSAFALDYTFVLNLVFAGVAAALVALHLRRQARTSDDSGHHHHGGSVQRTLVVAFLLVVGLGLGVEGLDTLGMVTLP